MSWIMTIAAGAALGYFLVQFDKKLAGVCGGIAEYLKVDPSIIRLVTILLMFGWGSGILAYIVCALVLPEE